MKYILNDAIYIVIFKNAYYIGEVSKFRILYSMDFIEKMGIKGYPAGSLGSDVHINPCLSLESLEENLKNEIHFEQ